MVSHPTPGSPTALRPAATVADASIPANGAAAKSTPVAAAPDSSLCTLLSISREYDARITRFLESEPESEVLRNVQRQTRISLGVIEDALQRYRFEEIAMSFNGGKDCLVMLILLLCGISRHCPAVSPAANGSSTASKKPLTTTPPSSTTQESSTQSIIPFPSIPSVYVMSSAPFAEVDEFVSKCITTYQLSVKRYPIPMKQAFQTYLDEHPKVKSILVGTRRTDPHGEHLTFFDRTDHGWPDFMRVHPVIDWHYREIWAFLRELEIEYCCLYDQGYTSLGGTTDTHPNPVLELKSDTSTNPAANGKEHRFRPAYELMADEEERLGRDCSGVAQPR
ncbi:hypothetical protein DFH27DRAFT_50147 [Peziza echinospora]|nr:hypothetical protein DFH27DRAFT_50147 [Peziza echinospora]